MLQRSRTLDKRTHSLDFRKRDPGPWDPDSFLSSSEQDQLSLTRARIYC